MFSEISLPVPSQQMTMWCFSRVDATGSVVMMQSPAGCEGEISY